MTLYIGLDVHSKFTQYCIQDEQGETLATGQFETSPEGIASFVQEFEIPPGHKDRT